MKTKLSCLLIFCFASLFGQEIPVRLAPDEDAPTISRHIYGHFAEHLGRCVYDGFYVGEDSEIPNTMGVRNDIVEALRALKIPNLRWPGGCFADTYHWKDGIGPKADRPSMLNIWWGNVREDNSFGTHEFLNMCELLGTEPYLSANVGSGTPQEFSDWIKYTTHPAGSSPMPELREKYGRQEPWTVKFWGIGNEAWGCGGNMRPEYYADVFRRFSTFATDYNNSDGLIRIASGASSGDYHWTEVLMKNIPSKLIEAIALHHYSVIDWGDKGEDVEFGEWHYARTMQEALKMDELIAGHTAIMDRYDPERKIELFVDEWGAWYDNDGAPSALYQQNTMRDAMVAAATLNIFNNHAERVTFANLAQAVNVLQSVILTDGPRILLTPTYHVMRMYTVHHDAKLIPVEYTSPIYEYKDIRLPAVSVSASRAADGASHLSVANVDPARTHTLRVDVSLLNLTRLSAEILTSDNLQDHNSFAQPERITVEDFSSFRMAGNELVLTIPPLSVVVIRGE